MEEDPKDLAFQTVQDVQALMKLHGFELHCSFGDGAYTALVVGREYLDGIDGLRVVAAGEDRGSLVEAIRIALAEALR